jgi:AAA+ superfamily predicted ATPase
LDTLEEFGTNVQKSDAAINPRFNKCEEVKTTGNKNIVANEYNQWQLLSNNTFTASFPTVRSIPSAMYELSQDDSGRLLFKQKTINADEFIFFPNSQLDEVLKEIDKFWAIKENFRKYKFTHKRGILLYGKAGVGKSVLLYQAIFNMINQNSGIILNVKCHPSMLIAALDNYKKIESDKNVIVIIEDLDAYIWNHGEESVLSFLDGENSCENTLTISTTNYPEKLDPRIVSRPRRFDRVIKINLPTDEMRRIYFEKKLNITNGEVEKYVISTKDFTFAAMTELVISTKCFEKEFEESVKHCRSLLNNKVSSEEYSDNQMGFGK